MIDVFPALRDLPITQITDHLEDFAPGRKRPFVRPFIIIDGEDELEEFVGHFPLFRLAPRIASTPARAAAAIQALPAIRLV
jgi:hypothetical protein